MGNDPVNNVDPDGGFIGPVFGNIVFGQLMGDINQYTHSISSGSNFPAAQVGSLVGNVALSIVGNNISEKFFPLPKPDAQSLHTFLFPKKERKSFFQNSSALEASKYPVIAISKFIGWAAWNISGGAEVESFVYDRIDGKNSAGELLEGRLM